MAFIRLNIDLPEHNQSYSGSSDVILRGGLVSLPEELRNVPLYYRWYSSLYSASADEIVNNSRFSINEDALQDPQSDYPVTVGIGTQAITLAVSDIQSEVLGEQQYANHVGVTGGIEGDAPCIIHVFKAELKETTVITSQLIEIRVVGPALWSVWDSDENQFVFNTEYEKVNRIQYRFVLSPADANNELPTVTLRPEPNELVIDETEPDVILLYRRELSEDTIPTRIAPGKYNLTLYLENKATDEVMDDASIEVNVED